MPLTETDRGEILQLGARYAHALDSHDAEGWADCFTTDGAFESGRQGRFEGQDALIGFSRRGKERAAESGTIGRHWTNHWVIDGDGDTATAACYAMVLDAAANGRVLVSFVYNDQLRKVDGSWKFVERVTTIDGSTDREMVGGREGVS